MTELYSWLCSFINSERGLGGAPGGAAFKLDRMMILARLAGHPELSCPVIHVAGSKGKGSVTAMAASILEAAGVRTARYMSPHVRDWRERISRGNGAFFSEVVYNKAGWELQALYGEYSHRLRKAGRARLTDEPTFFELATMLFFLCARVDRCEAMVVETGLGGRLDATNIVEPGASVITVIEKEHTEYLGNSLTEIAAEKAGIIKKNRPVVSAEQNADVLSALRRRAEEQGAPFIYAPDCAAVSGLELRPAGMDFCLTDNGSSLRVSGMPLTGKVYADNAVLAVLAVRRLFPFVDDASIVRGLAATSLPARFEKLRSNPPFIVDGAHTPLSVYQCAETFCALYGNGGILLFGCAADKDSGGMADILLPRFSRCIITAPGAFRYSDPAAVYESFRSRAAPYAADIVCVPETRAAVEEALKAGTEKSLPVLACGSFYLAAEISI